VNCLRPRVILPGCGLRTRTFDLFVDRGLDEALRFEAMNTAVGFVSEDLVAGSAAGREKRPALFEGK